MRRALPVLVCLIASCFSEADDVSTTIDLGSSTTAQVSTATTASPTTSTNPVESSSAETTSSSSSSETTSASTTTATEGLDESSSTTNEGEFCGCGWDDLLPGYACGDRFPAEGPVGSGQPTCPDGTTDGQPCNSVAPTLDGFGCCIPDVGVAFCNNATSDIIVFTCEYDDIGLCF